MTQDELKLVLDALKWCHGGEPCGTAEAIAVVEEALAQPQRSESSGKPAAWVGLTDEELHAVIRAGKYDNMEEFARAIEAKLKEKNT